MRPPGSGEAEFVLKIAPVVAGLLAQLPPDQLRFIERML
jgi:hypothetical protein